MPTKIHMDTWSVLSSAPSSPQSHDWGNREGRGKVCSPENGGEYHLFLAEEAGSVEERWARENFDATSVKANDTQAFPERGVLMRYLAEQLGPDRYHGLVAEFGTYSPMRILGALRAERRAHLYCPPESAPYESAKRELMEVFCPRSPAWRTSVLSKALMIIDQALAACARWT